MDLEKQRLLLSCLLADRDLLATCVGILKPSYFDPSLKKAVRFAIEYFERYKAAPTLATVRAESGVQLAELATITKAEQRYVADEVERFCRNKAMEEAILKGPELLKQGDYAAIEEHIRAAIAVGLQRDIGMDYFHDTAARLQRTLAERELISTGWPEVDELIGGGLARQELITFLANSGGGKSMTMLNLAKNLLLQGLNGVYISLEMSEAVISRRLDSMLTGIAQEALAKQVQQVTALLDKVKATRQAGDFIIKRLPENRTNVHHVRSYLEHLEQARGFKPDFIVIDYIDIMGSTHQVSFENMFIKDKLVTEEIRSLGFDYDCVMISASQLGRSALEAEKLHQGHVQGGMSKINTSDYVIGIKQEDSMRAAGEVYFDCLKSRNSAGVGRRLLLGWDQVSLNITSLSPKGTSLKLARSAANVGLASARQPAQPAGGQQGEEASIINLIET
jgi:replicative DNA helicase